MAENKEKRYVSDNAQLMLSWDWDKNNDLGLFPEELACGSNKKAWWICNKGHEWQAVIANRNKGIGCPICKSERNTSFPEYAILFYLKNYALDTVHSYKEQGYELDIYIPSKKVAIEYDGYYWHKDKIKKDLEKNLRCKKEGIRLYRIREGLLPLNDSSIDYIIQKDQKDLPQTIEKIISEIIGISISVDLRKDSIAIENLREYTEKENSVLFTNPEIAKEWNYEKNGKLKPENFLANSQKTVWWRCEKGHEWQSKILNRNYGYGCPYCSGRYAIKGENDLQTVNPTLAKEWDYDKNKGLTPSDVLPSSDKKVWWKCEKGHEWQTQIKVRTKGNGCPYCSGRYAIKGVNDLQTVNPALAKEWNHDKNGNLKPEEFLANSGKKVWWKCVRGHEWQETVDNRSNGVGCPYCSNHRVLKGYNDLQTVNPTLAKEWNYGKNGNLKPENFIAGSEKNVWWICGKGHEWKATIVNRNKGTGCPYCSGRKVLKGFNDLKTVNPALAIEWNYQKNGDLTPDNFTVNSSKKVWWKCSNGHEWQATIANRNYGTGCPICSNKTILIGYNDLKTINPIVIKDWNYEKNGDLKPEDFAANSGKKVWWKCIKGHEWQARIAERNKGYGCPYCSGRYVVKGDNDLQTVNPDLAKEWNFDRNGKLSPMDVSPNSNKKVWWKCDKGHEWQAIIGNRSKGNGCPECAKEKRKRK